MFFLSRKAEIPRLSRAVPELPLSYFFFLFFFAGVKRLSGVFTLLA